MTNYLTSLINDIPRLNYQWMKIFPYLVLQQAARKRSHPSSCGRRRSVEELSRKCSSGRTAAGQQPEKKDNKGKPPKAAAEKQSTTNETCQVGIDRTVYKLLTKQRKQNRNMIRMEEDEKEEEEKVGWRGPREEASEIPAQRRIVSKKNLVLTQFNPYSIEILGNMCLHLNKSCQ